MEDRRFIVDLANKKALKKWAQNEAIKDLKKGFLMFLFFLIISIIIVNA